MNLLPRMTSSLSKSVLAASIAYLGLAQQGEAAVTWLVSEVGNDLHMSTDGGSLSWSGGTTGNLTATSSKGTLENFEVFPGSGLFSTQLVAYDSGGSRGRVLNAGTAAAQPTLQGVIESATISTGDAFGFSGNSFFGNVDTPSVGTMTPISFMIFTNLDIATAFGTNLDAGPVLLWTANTGGTNTISVTLVPEPSSTALLGLGGLALMLRRRR